MSDNVSPFEESEQTKSQDTDTEARGRAPHHQGRSFSSGSWYGGAILIAVGVVVLLQRVGMDISFLRNWWALLLLFPAVGSLVREWRAYQSNGRRFTGRVLGAVIGDLALMLVAVILLFGLRWSVIWPIFLVLAGLGALIKSIAAR